jgi:alanine racemase
MRKTLLLFVVALIVVSCSDTANDINVNNTTSPTANVIDLKINSNAWIQNTDSIGTNKYYTYHFPMTEITSSVFNSGTISSYILTNNPIKQVTLPFTQHLQNSAGISWTQTIDFDYSVGGINLYVTNSALNADPPATMDFNITIQ